MTKSFCKRCGKQIPDFKGGFLGCYEKKEWLEFCSHCYDVVFKKLKEDLRKGDKKMKKTRCDGCKSIIPDKTGGFFGFYEDKEKEWRDLCSGCCRTILKALK